jgi:hypothetical protein
MTRRLSRPSASDVGHDDLREQIALAAVQRGELPGEIENLLARDLAADITGGAGLQPLHRNRGYALEADLLEGDAKRLQRLGQRRRRAADLGQLRRARRRPRRRGALLDARRIGGRRQLRLRRGASCHRQARSQDNEPDPPRNCNDHSRSATL